MRRVYKRPEARRISSSITSTLPKRLGGSCREIPDTSRANLYRFAENREIGASLTPLNPQLACGNGGVKDFEKFLIFLIYAPRWSIDLRVCTLPRTGGQGLESCKEGTVAPPAAAERAGCV